MNLQEGIDMQMVCAPVCFAIPHLEVRLTPPAVHGHLHVSQLLTRRTHLIPVADRFQSRPQLLHIPKSRRNGPPHSGYRLVSAWRFVFVLSLPINSG